MDPLVLARYLDGTAPAKMRAAVEAWIAADPRRRAALHELETAWRSAADHRHAPHDLARPFAVHAGRSHYRDSGTKFGVDAYGNRAAERVAVVEGAVGVTVPAVAATTVRETPLVAGQVATLSPSDGVRVLRRASAADAVAWTRGRLVFRGTPLGEAAEQLGRWYDLDVRVESGELARRPVTGAYSDEPVDEVLMLITAAVGARYEWQGRSVTIVAQTGR